MKRILLSLILLLGLTVPSWAVVSSTINQNKYACDSTTTSWPYTFPIILTTDIQVWTIDSSGNPTQQNSNFSVNTVTQSVTYPVTGSACATGNSLLLIRVQSLTQQVAASNQGPAPSPIVMTMSDKLTMIAQQLQGEINLALLQPVGSSGSITFPSSSPGQLIGWNGSGALSNITNPSAVAQWSLNGANIYYNLGNVGVGSSNPGQKLDVQGTVRSLSFATTGSSSSTFSGNVGIGSITPGQMLDVQGTVRAIGFTGNGANITNIGGLVGVAVSKSEDTNYQAATDGTMTVCIGDGSNTGLMDLETDSSTSPSTVIEEIGPGAVSFGRTCGSAQVKKGNYYAFRHSGTLTVNYCSFTSSGN